MPHTVRLFLILFCFRFYVCLFQMMQNGMADVLAATGVNIPSQNDMDEGDRKTNLIVNYLPQTMTQVYPLLKNLWNVKILSSVFNF